MRAKDLMIGNLYEATDGSGVSIVTGKDLYAWNQGAVYGRPIPLTDEWLIKFGYTGYGTLGEMNLFKYENGSYRVRSFGNTVHVNLKYVHQLMNLFYALTREELTINKEKI